jgi:hypothetical protein
MKNSLLYNGDVSKETLESFGFELMDGVMLREAGQRCSLYITGSGQVYIDPGDRVIIANGVTDIKGLSDLFFCITGELLLPAEEKNN